MKGILPAGIIICLGLALLIAGCTTQPPSAPVTAVSTPFVTSSPTAVPASAPAQVKDPLLQGNWFLKQIGEQGGSAPVLMTNMQINIIFDNAGNFQGSTGCNNYKAQYTLSGQQLYNGMGMTIGPVASTNKYCTDSVNTEETYFQILQKTTSYVVNSNGELTLTDNLNSNLVYTRNPSSPMPRY
ncbi:MAG: META domain-containing protein [Methanoregulaceae archaeon]|jgi:heat shock protein HslJ|nr:META domain-containing protein [Methanoregulaceae archaeon]